MNQTIIIKRSTVQGKVPINLQPGELAVNLVDRIIYTAGIGGQTFALNKFTDYAGNAYAGDNKALSRLQISSDGTWTYRSIDIPTTLPASDVYPWAKEAEKPEYTASEVGALSENTTYAASSTVGGSAISAERLSNNSPIGSVQRPVYFNENGVPVACDHLLAVDVPVDAKLTDTTEFTISANVNTVSGDPITLTGTAGTNSVTYQVEHDQALSGTPGAYGPSGNVTGNDGATVNIPRITVDAYGHVTAVENKVFTAVDTTYTEATTTTPGLMSAADKAKLDGFGTVMNFQGSKANATDVYSITSANKGDVWVVNSAFTLDGISYPAGTSLICTTATSTTDYGSSHWAAMSSSVDLSGYAEIDSTVLTKSTVVAALGF